MPMTGRERVLAAITHEEPDRVPIILGTSNTTGMKIRPYRELRGMLGLTGPEKYIYDWYELGTLLMEEPMFERLHSDARGVLDRFPAWVYERNRDREPHSPFIDDSSKTFMPISSSSSNSGLQPRYSSTPTAMFLTSSPILSRSAWTS